MSRKLLVLLALCVIAVIVAYRALGWDFNWSLFVSSLSGMKAGWLVASMILTIVTHWFRAVRWQILLSPLKAIRVLPLFSITIVGFCAIFILGRAGEVARPIWLTRREKVTLTGSIATIVVERFLDALMLISFFTAALLAAEVPNAASTLGILKKTAWFTGAATGAAFIALFLVRTNSAWIVRMIPFKRIASWVEGFAQGLSFLRSGKSFGLAMFQSVVIWFVIVLQFWFMMLGMNFKLSAATAVLVMAGSAIGSLAQIPGVGGGFQAGYVFCVTALLGIPLEQAIATSLVATLVSFIPTIAISLPFILADGLSFRDLKAV